MPGNISRNSFGLVLGAASLGLISSGLVSLGLATPAFADAASTSTGSGVGANSGAEVYQHVCQGCHMANGKGAVGAAAIPAFAGNMKLQSSGYPVYVVLNGMGAMPWFNGVLNDQQIAGVANYIRTNFGNHYTDPVTPADVAGTRGPVPTPEHEE